MITSSIYLVSCVGKKKDQPSAAHDLYLSDWFLKARSVVEATGKSWFILSAEHGLLSPHEIIAPYDKTLNGMRVGDRLEWTERVYLQMLTKLPRIEQVTFFAGQRYREFLVPQLVGHGTVVSVPMEGLAIGKQLSWLKSELGKLT